MWSKQPNLAAHQDLKQEDDIQSPQLWARRYFIGTTAKLCKEAPGRLPKSPRA